MEEEGCFVAFTTHPDFKISQSNPTKYGLTVLNKNQFPKATIMKLSFTLLYLL